MRYEQIEQLNNAFRDLYPPEVPLVYGEGPIPCAIMLAGEAPGADEIRTGRPFTGMAGKNLDSFMEVLGLTRADIYIGNVCKFRPHRVSAKGTVANRTPTTTEIRQALPLFHEEIKLVSPRLLITLGNTPLHAVTGDWSLKVGNVHGTCLPLDIGGSHPCVFALYHPASIIYNPKLKEAYAADLLVLRQRVDEVLERKPAAKREQGQ